jgi:hypothetical protein
VTWCRHYRASANNDTCNAGVDYKTVRVYEKDNPLVRKGFGVDMPCWNEALKNCPLQEWPSAEEQAEEMRQAGEAFLKWITNLESNICNECGAPVESEQQVGRCVYARPCGHRLYQGKVGAFKKK